MGWSSKYPFLRWQLSDLARLFCWMSSLIRSARPKFHWAVMQSVLVKFRTLFATSSWVADVKNRTCNWELKLHWEWHIFFWMESYCTFLKSLNRPLLKKSRKRCGGLARNWFEDVNPHWKQTIPRGSILKSGGLKADEYGNHSNTLQFRHVLKCLHKIWIVRSQNMLQLAKVRNQLGTVFHFVTAKNLQLTCCCHC